MTNRPGSPPAAAQVPDLRGLRGDVAWAPGPVWFIVDVYGISMGFLWDLYGIYIGVYNVIL